MKNKFEKFTPFKSVEIFTKETARARYENLEIGKAGESIAQRETLADIKIKKAMAEGEFDNLPGKGKPLNLQNYCDIPEHLRIAYQMLKNSGYLPEEVRLKKELENFTTMERLSRSYNC